MEIIFLLTLLVLGPDGGTYGGKEVEVKSMSECIKQGTEWVDAAEKTTVTIDHKGVEVYRDGFKCTALILKKRTGI